MRFSLITLIYIILLSPSVLADNIITIKGMNGQSYNAIVAGPTNSDMGVIIVHDWFGITDFTKEASNRLAKKGARVVAIDLYKGKSATTHDQAKKLQKELDSNYAQNAITAALQNLRKENRHIAIIGYSAGGKYALRAAYENPKLITAVALIYGGGYTGEIKEKQISISSPILTVYGSEDNWSYKSSINLKKLVRGQIQTYVHPGAKHAFAQKLFNKGKNLDPVATKAMRKVLDNFLERSLKVKLK